jgi:hypothetical protein
MKPLRSDEPGLPHVQPLSVGVLAALVAAKLAVHLPLLGRYGTFRDELYFLDCARHLDWGYVDHAPLVAVYAKVALLLGGSLPALRLIPALAGAALVALAVLLARELGGGRVAQAAAGGAVLVSPIFLMLGSVMTMNAFEPLFWMGAAWVLLRLVRTGDSRLWLAFGALVGLGLENKHSTVFFGVAVAAAVVLTPLRRELARPWIWLGAAVALLLFAPNLIWQWQHGFPTLEDLRNVRESGKNVELGPLAFLVQQILMVHPVLFPLWTAGLAHLLAGRGRVFRALGLVYLALLGIFMALHGKNYYLAPAYPMLFAAGGVAFEAWTARVAAVRLRHGLRAVSAALVVAAGALTAPLSLPLLDPPDFLAYQAWLGIAPEKTEVAHDGPLPQLWGDQFGWPELAADVAAVVRALPPEDRARACIFANNYGEAGALNHFGPALGLPPVVSGHQTHFFWGPKDCTGEVLVVTQDDRESLERWCTAVEEAGHHEHPWGMAEENGAIWVCRGLKLPLSEAWPRVKHWN